LKPQGWVVLIWNERRTAATPFLRDYEQLLLTYGTDYKEVRHERTTDTIHEFFAPAPYEERVFELRQHFDFEGAAGRLLSSSYAPLAGHPNLSRSCKAGHGRLRIQHARVLRKAFVRGDNNCRFLIVDC
jgi:hypothetical protein